MSYLVFLAAEKRRIANLETEVKDSDSTSLLKVYKNTSQHYLVRGGIDELNRKISKKDATNHIVRNLDIKKDYPEKAADFKADILSDIKRLFLTIWGSKQEGGKTKTTKEYEAILKKIQEWHSSFNDKASETVEEELKKTEIQKNVFDNLPDASIEQRNHLNSQYAQAEERLRTKQGLAESVFQRILGLLQDEIDNLESQGKVYVTKLSSGNLLTYLREFHNKDLNKLELSPNKLETLKKLFDNLKSVATSLKASLLS